MDHGVFWEGGAPHKISAAGAEAGRARTMAWRILQAHNRSQDPKKLKLAFDAMVSHDITYVGIIQQARASGMDVIAAMGFHNLTLAASSLAAIHAPLIEHIKNGVVTHIETSGMDGL